MTKRKGQAPKQPLVVYVGPSMDDDDDQIHALSSMEIIALDPDAWGQDDIEVETTPAVPPDRVLVRVPARLGEVNPRREPRLRLVPQRPRLADALREESTPVRNPAGGELQVRILDTSVGFLRSRERAEVDHPPAVFGAPADTRADMPARPTVRRLPSYAMRGHEEDS